MSFFSTLGQLVDKVQDDLDLKEEDFIDRPEIVGYANEAVRDCQALIHTIYNDYFLSFVTIPLIQNIADYPLPADIYANKIRYLLYDDGSLSYQIKRLRNFRDIPFILSSDYMQFIPTNVAGVGIRLRLYPTPVISRPNALTCWYLRRTKILVNDSDVCDIPEFTNYILAHMKYSCMKKEGHPELQEQMSALAIEKDLMVETLTNMIVDDDNKITQDLSMYEELS